MLFQHWDVFCCHHTAIQPVQRALTGTVWAKNPRIIRQISSFQGGFQEPVHGVKSGRGSYLPILKDLNPQGVLLLLLARPEQRRAEFHVLNSKLWGRGVKHCKARTPSSLQLIPPHQPEVSAAPWVEKHILGREGWKGQGEWKERKGKGGGNTLMEAGQPLMAGIPVSLGSLGSVIAPACAGDRTRSWKQMFSEGS